MMMAREACQISGSMSKSLAASRGELIADTQGSIERRDVEHCMLLGSNSARKFWCRQCRALTVRVGIVCCRPSSYGQRGIHSEAA